MADVRARFDGDSDRGQLLLVTALALAVMLVTVALLLNTAIFTENVATRDTTADGSEAIELRGEAIAAVGELIEIKNRQGGGDTGDVEDGVDAMGPLVDRERARHGTIAELRYDSNETGTLFRWADPDDPREFTSGGDSNWTLVDGLGNARGLVLNLDSDQLEDLSDPDATTVENQAFGVRFVNTNPAVENVTQYIYHDTNTDRVVITKANESSDLTQQCTIDHTSGNTTVDLTGDRLSTDESVVDCFRDDGLWANNEFEEIEFRNGDSATGTFEVTVDIGASSPTDVEGRNAIYSVTVDITYQSQDLTFETTTTVAPGEPR